jgi:hypothetical protein
VGFFDFMNRQGDQTDAETFQPLAAGNMTSTRIIQALLELPKADRNQAWSNQFMAHVADAAFFGRYPSVVTGADLPYFALHSTQGEQPLPTHVIHHMQNDILLEQGLGVVINPSGQDSDWAFSYGDILHFHLHGTFYPAKQTEAASPVQGMAPQSRLPQAARKALRVFLQGLGVAAPRVMFAAWDHAGPGSLELVFNFSPQEFNSVDQFRFAMNNISWYLPRNYSYSVAGKQTRNEGAFELL